MVKHTAHQANLVKRVIVPYRSYTSTVQLEHFINSPYQFGMEATIPVEGVRKFSTISRNQLAYYLYHTAKAADPNVLNITHYDKKTGQILTELLGSEDTYCVESCLNKLRAINNKTAKHKLLIRILALISFDLLDPRC